jgi:hypothetical protein
MFLAELLDDDSVIKFYEDFARLAFEDGRGSVKQRCKLLKYQIGESWEVEKNREHGEEEGVGMIRGMKSDSERLANDVEINCSYCWTMKRDVFDILILIVLNVSLPFCLFMPLMNEGYADMLIDSSCLASEGLWVRMDLSIKQS